MNFKSKSVVILILLFFIGCKKSIDPQEGRLLKQIIYADPGILPPVKDTFLYNSQNRLVSIKHLNSSSYFDKAVEFDGNGRLIKVDYSYKGDDYFTCSFIYNSSGKIIKKIATPFQGYQYAYDKSYTYDLQGRVLTDTTYFQQTDKVLYYTTYRYDANGNIVESDFQDLSNPSSSSKRTYVYDNKPNPFNILGPVYFFVTGSTSYLNQNNGIGDVGIGQSPILNNIEYQQNGLPKKMDFTNLSPFKYDFSVIYEYQ